jgi:hypothetical protein
MTHKSRPQSKLEKTQIIDTWKSSSRLHDLKLKTHKRKDDVRVYLKSLYSDGLETYIKKAPVTMRGNKSVRQEHKYDSKSAKRSQYTVGSTKSRKSSCKNTDRSTSSPNQIQGSKLYNQSRDGTNPKPLKSILKSIPKSPINLNSIAATHKKAKSKVNVRRKSIKEIYTGASTLASPNGKHYSIKTPNNMLNNDIKIDLNDKNMVSKWFKESQKYLDHKNRAKKLKTNLTSDKMNTVRTANYASCNSLFVKSGYLTK